MNLKWFGAGAALAVLAALLLVPPAAAVIDNTHHINVNSIDCVVTNHDSYAYDLISGNAGLVWPKGSAKTAVFAAGLWVGARVDTVGPSGVHGLTAPIVKVGEYSTQWGPGPMVNGKGAPDSPDYRVYTITRGDSTSADFLNWPAALGAPVDSRGRPQVLGDMTLWSVFNDRSKLSASNRAGTDGLDSLHSLGLEVQQTTFGFSRSGSLNNIIFLKFKFINKGGSHLRQTYVSVWADPDLGDATDDLVGCDTSLSVGYVYNSTNNDGVYGVAPPSVGWDFFQGPLDKSTGKRLPMTSFVHYINGKDPQSASGSYNNMKGLAQDGSSITCNGAPTSFDANGDPVTGAGCLDPDAPADRRLMLSSGPFDMDPGDTQEVVVGVIVGRGGNNLSSITVMKQEDQDAQFAFNANFDLGSPPPAPIVTVRPVANAIDLTWNDLAVHDIQHKVFVDTLTGDTLRKEYVFQGYNVWEAASPTLPQNQWKKVATYDVATITDSLGDTQPDSVLLIYSDVTNPTTGAIERVLEQSGTNSGLQFRYFTTTDPLTGNRIVNNKPYFFAVTAYNYEALHTIPFIESHFNTPQGIVTETLENDPAGQALTIIPSSSTSVFSGTLEHTAGTAEATAEIIVFRPDQPDSLAGHTFEVTFFPNPEGDPPLLWRLTDITTGKIVLDNQSSFIEAPDITRPQSDFELLFHVPYPISSAAYAPEEHDPFTGISGQVYHGGLQLAREFFGTSLTDADLVPVKLVFDPAGGQMAYAYERGGSPSYGYQGFGTVPFRAYDVSNPAHPRQVNVGFVQNHGDSTDTDPPRWLPAGVSDPTVENGGREYLFILKSDYSETPLPQYATTGQTGPVRTGEADAMYTFWLARATAAAGQAADANGFAVPVAGDSLSIQLHKVLTTSDKFRFVLGKTGVAAGTVVNNDITRIRVVPNPYYNHSTYEVNQFNRVVKFTHLPGAPVTIRIFDLNGDLVRTLVRNDVSKAELTWDLLNESQLPVASGVYVYHVDAKGIGSTVGRLVVFLEREKLNFF